MFPIYFRTPYAWLRFHLSDYPQAFMIVSEIIDTSAIVKEYRRLSCYATFPIYFRTSYAWLGFHLSEYSQMFIFRSMPLTKWKFLAESFSTYPPILSCTNKPNSKDHNSPKIKALPYINEGKILFFKIKTKYRRGRKSRLLLLYLIG